jgi:bifunctional non-homologous end joining protein LigD
VKPRSATPAELPDFVEPMQAKLVNSILPGDWIHEVKFDGYRALALRGGPETKLLSRNQKNLGKKFPEIVEAIASLDLQDAIIDGEIVALDDQGRSSFQALQAFEMDTERPAIVFYAFDLLRLNGKDLRDLPTKSEKRNWQNFLQNLQPHFDIRSASRKTLKSFWKRPGHSGLRG